jgi:hypothetical protein
VRPIVQRPADRSDTSRTEPFSYEDVGGVDQPQQLVAVRMTDVEGKVALAPIVELEDVVDVVDRRRHAPDRDLARWVAPRGSRSS